MCISGRCSCEVVLVVLVHAALDVLVLVKGGNTVNFLSDWLGLTGV